MGARDPSYVGMLLAITLVWMVVDMAFHTVQLCLVDVGWALLLLAYILFIVRQLRYRAA